MFNDWNGDGKIDSTDEFMDYQMMNDDTFGSGSSSSSSEGVGCLILMIVVNVFLALLDLFIS